MTISPSWFDPSTAPPQITPFGMLYAIHDALVRPYPGHKMGPSLAESWQESPDGKTYQFKLRPGLKFHNGDPLTTEDVKFSFERYKGAGAKVLQDHVAQVEIVDPLVVRFHLKEPWPDFMTFYGTTASAAGIIVPKKYLCAGRRRRLQEASDRRRPLQVRQPQAGRGGRAGGHPAYWRRVPNVKTLIMKSVPEATTRAVMVKTGEADIAWFSTAPRPRRSSAIRACRWWRRSTRRSSGSSSPSNGTPSRRGTTSGCAWRPTTRSTASGSTRRRASASARRRA